MIPARVVLKVGLGLLLHPFALRGSFATARHSIGSIKAASRLDREFSFRIREQNLNPNSGSSPQNPDALLAEGCPTD